MARVRAANYADAASIMCRRATADGWELGWQRVTAEEEAVHQLRCAVPNVHPPQPNPTLRYPHAIKSTLHVRCAPAPPLSAGGFPVVFVDDVRSLA